MSDQIMIKASHTFKEAAATYAATHNKTLSELVRETVAAVIGYDLSADDALDTRGPKRKYASDDVRKTAANERARKRASHQRAVVAAIQKQAEREAADRAERLEGAAALAAYLERHGVSLDDDDDDDDSKEETNSAA